MTTQALYDPPKVGGDCLAWCTKCKMELAHVIVSMVSARPAKVICKTCKSQHNFKRGPGSSPSFTAGRAKAARKPAERTYVRVADMWEKKMAENKEADVKAYTVQASFVKGDVISHPKFGMGLVEDVKSNGKMTVLFREDEKTLIHGLQKT